MARTILLDTGVLVAALNSKDIDHRRVLDCLAGLRGRFVTVEGVLVEASHLLRKLPRACGLVVDATLRLECAFHPATPGRLARASEIVAAHRALRLDLVDALLVVAAEELSIKEILTLDHRDFSAIQLRGGRRFRLLPER